MYKAYIQMTGKSYRPGSQWLSFGDGKLSADSLKELKAKLAEKYGKSWKHRKPMYCDKKDGSTVRTGYVVGFRADEGSSNKWIQQDWISFAECNPITWKG